MATDPRKLRPSELCRLLNSTPLGEVISNYAGLIKAMILVDDLMSDLPANDPCIMVSCTCWPPRTIQLRQSVMAKAEILCENCSQPFLERE